MSKLETDDNVGEIQGIQLWITSHHRRKSDTTLGCKLSFIIKIYALKDLIKGLNTFLSLQFIIFFFVFRSCKIFYFFLFLIIVNYHCVIFRPYNALEIILFLLFKVLSKFF